MRCYSCERNPEFVCICKYTLICSNHLMTHMKLSGYHSCEPLSLHLDSSISKKFQKVLKSRLKEISDSKNEISSLARSMITKIKVYSKLALKELNIIENLYLSLLSLSSVSQSLKEEANRVLETNMLIKVIYGDIDPLLKQTFTQDLVYFERKNSSVQEIHESEDTIKEKEKIELFEMKFKETEERKARIEEFEKIEELRKKIREQEDKGNEEVISIEQMIRIEEMERELKLEQELEERIRPESEDRGCFPKFGSKDEGIFSCLFKRKTGSNNWKLDKKKYFMETFKIAEYQNYFGPKAEFNHSVDDIKFTSDGKYSFICKLYLGN